jgi:hypothetical protein
MTKDVKRSATIHQFPVGGRAGLDRNEPAARFAPEWTVPFAKDILVGSSWYHDEAIRDAERARKARQ